MSGADVVADDGAIAALLAAAESWRAQDPDPETRAELDGLIVRVRASDAAATADLRDRFENRLAFGTAGLRGGIAAGPNRMNRVLVAQAAAGLAAYLREKGAEAVASPDAQDPSVVIGYDGRKNSEVFARDTAELMAGAGIRAILLPRLLPTPVLAFAVRHLGVSAGVMVTASHNPPNDNGYKVYLGGADGGSQIVPPADREIAEHILRVASGSIAGLPRSEAYEVASEDVMTAYVDATAGIVSGSRADRVPVDVVFTAMHGVGWETASRVFDAAGLPRPRVVAEQIEPDPAFPTVSFPNPEEPGALDLAFATALEAGAELIVANDPDADRLAVAIPDVSQPGRYRRLSGNEVGALLGWQAAEGLIASAGEVGPLGALVCSIVSSPALAAVAREYSLDFAETLTGFKWVSRAPGIVYGFEEALGYLVDPDVVRDKDGISAAVAFLDLAGRLKAQGLSIADQLDRFSERFGHFASDQVSIRVDEPAQIGRMMQELRERPPADFDGIAVDRVDDLADGWGDLPPSDVLRIHLVDGSRVMIRPSGTEPKLKVYLDASSREGTAAERRQKAESTVARLVAATRALLRG